MILVTGGCGYIGSHVVKALTESGEEVIVLDDLSHGSQSNLLHNEKLITGDITDKALLESIFDQCEIDTVIHLAALVNAAESNTHAEAYRNVNEYGSIIVWETAVKAKVKHLLYASSAAVYGTPASTDPISETHPTRPSNVYGETKLAGENTLKSIVGKDTSYGVFRFFNVGGAESEGRLGQSRDSIAIMQRLFAVANNEIDSLLISGHDYDTHDGTVVRDFVHVEDISLAFLLGLNHLRSGKESFTLNLGSGEAHTIGEVVKEVEVVTGKKINIKYGSRINGDIEYSLADITNASRLLGWEPTSTLRLIVRDGWNSYLKRFRA